MSTTPLLLQALIGLLVGAVMAAAFKQVPVRAILVLVILVIVGSRAYSAAPMDLHLFLDAFLVDLEGALVWLTERPMLAGGATTGYTGWYWVRYRRQSASIQA